MKKNLVLILLMAFFPFSLITFAQTTQEQDLKNLKKYWYYHYRLLNDFMAKGDCQGCSEPINERGFKGKDVTDPTPSHTAKWGDQTIALGHYIAVLATEFKLLQDANQPTDTTIEELYYAIKAFNRLDETAEVSQPNPPHAYPGQPAELNGFFIRDDVYTGFLQDHPKLAHGVTSARQIDTENSDFITGGGGNEMSHDQVWYLFTGFSLVRKFLYPGITYHNQELNDKTHNTDIYQEAADITNRILDYMKVHSWIIRNPNTGDPVERGDFVVELSYGAAEAACYINNLNVTPNPIPFPIHSCDDSHDYISLTDAPLWMDFGKGIGNLVTISTEDYKLQQLAAVGNSWWTSAQPFFPDPIPITVELLNPLNFLHPFTFISTLVQSTTPIPPVNVTTFELGTRAIVRDNQHLPLLRQVLHGGSNLVSNNYYENLLNSAPCEGPRCFAVSGGECSTFEWSATDRLHDSEERVPNPFWGYSHASSQGEY